MLWLYLFELTYMGKCFEIDCVLCCRGSKQHHVMQIDPSLGTKNTNHSSNIILAVFAVWYLPQTQIETPYLCLRAWWTHGH